jgi:hypothetical protein
LKPPKVRSERSDAPDGPVFLVALAPAIQIEGWTMESERSSFTINEICKRNHISRGKYFAQRRAGLGPVEMHLGPSTVRITAEAERAWQRARENPAGAELVELHQGKAELTARGSAAGTVAAKSPKHVSKTGRRKRRAR